MNALNPHRVWNLGGKALPEYTCVDQAPELIKYHPSDEDFRVWSFVVPFSETDRATHVRMVASQDWEPRIQVIINDLRFRPSDGVDWTRLNARADPGHFFEGYELWDWTLTIETIDSLKQVVDKIRWVTPVNKKDQDAPLSLVTTRWHWEHGPSFM